MRTLLACCVLLTGCLPYDEIACSGSNRCASSLPDGGTAPSDAASGGRPAFYINFQDPNGFPVENPLVVNGHTWMKVGWSPYDAQKGYGWSGPNIGTSVCMYQYISGSQDELQRSIIYDDNGAVENFLLDLPNGNYKVTASIGWQGQTSADQDIIFMSPQTTALFVHVATTSLNYYQVGSTMVSVQSGQLVMVVGVKNSYTFLDWLSVEPM